MGRPSLSGEIGCYSSHLSVWRELFESGNPVDLVLEDSVVFLDEILEPDCVLSSTSDDWDLVRMFRVFE